MVQIDHTQTVRAVRRGLLICQKFPHLTLNAARDLVRRPLQQDAALLHHQDRIGDVGDVGNDVRGQDHDFFSGKIRNEIAQTHALLRVQARRRLVQDQDRGIVQLRLGDAQTLLHAAGKGFDPAVCRVVQVDYF